MADLVALGYLESYEAVTLVATTSFTVNAVAGMSFAAGDTMSVTWSTSSSMSSPTTTATTSLTGKVLGDAVTRAVTGLSTNTTYYYQVNIAIAATSTTYTGAVRTMTTQPGTSATVKIGLYSDSHLLDKINGAQTNALAVHARTISNIVADAPGLLLDIGDNTPHAHFNSGDGNRFPINKDGASVSATSLISTAQSDCNYDLRLWRRNSSTMHTGAMVVKAPGNHDGEQWWDVAANNSGRSDSATYSRTAWNTYMGNMNSSALWGGDATGRWGSFQWGPMLICIFNPYIDTRLSVSNPASATRDAPDALDDWCLDDTQWSYFFDPSTGVITTASTSTSPFILCCMHHLIGGISHGGLKYARGGKKYVVDKAGGASLEHGIGAAWMNPRSWTASGDTHGSLGFHKALIKRCNATGCIPVVVKGHDHLYAREWVDGILYLTMPRTGSLNATPYDDGFKTAGGYGDSDANTRYASNSGHVLLTCSPTVMTFQYKRAYVGGLGVADPSDGIVINGAIVDQVQVTTITKARSFIRDTGNRVSEDSVAIANAGSTQTGYPSVVEPKGLSTMFGGNWKLYSSATGANTSYLAVRTSLIDSAQVIACRRPITIGATAVRQAALHNLYGINREIRVKFRLPSTSSVAPIFIYIAAKNVGSTANNTWGAINKGLYLNYVHGGTGTLSVRWDNGTNDSAGNGITGTNSVSFTAPNNTSFDNGIRILLQGCRVTVFSSASAKIIDCTLGTDQNSHSIIGLLRADATYHYVGMCGATNNVGGAGYIQEFKDFQARALT